jgi:hypothetical protein
MEKDAAAIDTVEFTDNFICRSSITRSDMLFITFGSSIIIVLPYGIPWSLSRHIRPSREAQNKSFPYSSLLKRRILSTKVLFFSQNAHFYPLKTGYSHGFFAICLAKRIIPLL